MFNYLIPVFVVVSASLQCCFATPIFLKETLVQEREAAPTPTASDTYDPFDEVFKRAKSRVKATTVTQSINNWIEDVVNKFLDVALALPLGAPLKAGATKALAFAKDEPVNVKFLKATPGFDAAGLAAATELEKVFGDVLDQLADVVASPVNLNVALRAVTRINVNRCKNVLPDAETMWKSAAVAMKIATADWPPRANREVACPGIN